MSSRTFWWSVTMAIIAAIYFCTTPATDSFSDTQELISKAFRLLCAK